MTRLYQPIWDKLKSLSKHDAETKGITITAPAPLHRRIVRAVKKEKHNDLGYKMLLKEQDDRDAIIVHSRLHSTITFKLKFTIGIKDL